MIQLRVQTGTSSYTISVGNRAWHEVGRFCRREKYSSVFIVTESRIWRAWGKKFLRATGLPSGSVLLVPPGERSPAGTSSYSISVGNGAWHEVGRFCRRKKILLGIHRD